jgi:hypothetical protein
MKFSIRDLLLVTVIVALAAGWWVHRRAMNDEFRRMDSENEALRDELLELQFPKMERGEIPQVSDGGTHTLEWILPAGN